MQEFSAPTLRIHGDNMIECERALRVIARALALKISFVARPIYFPRYALGENSKTRFDVELLAGHARWNVNLQCDSYDARKQCCRRVQRVSYALAVCSGSSRSARHKFTSSGMTSLASAARLGRKGKSAPPPTNGS